MEGQEHRGPQTSTGACLSGAGEQRDSRGLVLDQASDLPSRLSACRSMLWPLGPCCSTCTQVTPQAWGGRAGGQGGGCPSVQQQVQLEPWADLLPPGALSPALQGSSSCLLGWVGRQGAGLSAKEELSSPKNGAPFICSGVCRTQTVALVGQLRQRVGPEVSAEGPPRKLCLALLRAALGL